MNDVRRPQRVVLLGATGQLGADLARAFSLASHDWHVTALGPGDVDVRDHDAVRNTLHGFEPAIIINATAYNRVDDAERDATTAFAINTVAVHNLARIAREAGAKLVHISTDFVYGGDMQRGAPYRESDPPAPQSVYATSKLAGEQVIRAVAPRHLIVRTSGLYGGGRDNRGDMSSNFVLTMLALAEAGKPLKVVDDQRLSPTPTRELAGKILELLGAGAEGLVHLTAGGDCTWFEFARSIFELAHVPADLTPTTSAQWAAPAARPPYSVLISEVLPKLGIAPMRPWREALADYLRQIGRLEG